MSANDPSGEPGGVDNSGPSTEPSSEDAETTPGALGNFIREQRNAAQLSLRALAERADVSNPYLSQIERGLHEPSVRVLNSIAKALNLSAETLLRQAGALGDGAEEGAGNPTVAAINRDPALSEQQKQELLAVYRALHRVTPAVPAAHRTPGMKRTGSSATVGRVTVTDANAAADPETATVDAKIDELLDGFDPATVDEVEFRGCQYDLGLAWVHFPEGWGGLDLAPNLQGHVDRRLREARAPQPGERHFFGLTMAGPTVVTHGTDQLRRRLLRPMFTGEDAWCQLFSEPGAGSDLAGLACKAERDGDEWVINGQKVWNTLAHVADRGMLVTRSDPSQPKHKGLTYFALDMHAPGVEVRPLRQITGEAEFNEVYLTDVRVPDADRVGDVGEGWRVAMSTLMNERTTIGGGSGPPGKGTGAIAEAVRIWNDEPVEHGAVARDRLMQLWIEAETLRLTNIRAGQNRKAGNPGPEGSIAKLRFAEVNTDIYEFCVGLLGARGLVDYDYQLKRASFGLVGPPGSSRKMFLRSRANSIEGGTSEIQRNIIGERVLGLPGEPRVDKDIPWSEVPR